MVYVSCFCRDCCFNVDKFCSLDTPVIITSKGVCCSKKLRKKP
jgi:hypothetical protein